MGWPPAATPVGRGSKHGCSESYALTLLQTRPTNGKNNVQHGHSTTESPFQTRTPTHSGSRFQRKPAAPQRHKGQGIGPGTGPPPRVCTRC